MYGLGAMYGKSDMSKQFIAHRVACIGWGVNEAPALYMMLRKVKVSDFIYIKSISIANKELIIKAVGVVVDDKIEDYSYGNGVNVIWLWTGEEKIKLDDLMYKNNVFNNTLYEEHNLELQQKILGLVFNVNIPTITFGEVAIKKEKIMECLSDFSHEHSDEELQRMTIDELQNLLNDLTDYLDNPRDE